MMILIKFIILIFLISPIASKASDISDFEIEGISIDESALNFFSKEEIKRNKQNYFNDETYSVTEIEIKSYSETYDAIQIYYKRNDKKYFIKGVTGFIDLLNNVNDCSKIQKEIDNEISGILDNFQRKEDQTNHPADKTGKSKVNSVIYSHTQGTISLRCVNWSEDMNYIDNFHISINSNELNEWLNNFAYK